MTLLRKLIIGKVLFAIVVCLITVYLMLEKPGKHSFSQPSAEKTPLKNEHEYKEAKGLSSEGAQLSKLQKQLTQMSSVRQSLVDRPLVTNSGGHLSLSPAITRYFEYFHSVHAQFSSDELLKLFSQDVKQHYPKNFQQEIIRLFACFLDYKKSFALALSEMDEHDVNYIMSRPSNYHELKHGIRQQFFSAEEIDALFLAYENQLKTPSTASANQLKYQAYQQAKKAGQPATMYDDQTQQRLASLEQQRGVWQQRLNDYAQQRNAITKSGDLDSYGKQEAVNALLERLFSAREIMRVSALERGGIL